MSALPLEEKPSALTNKAEDQSHEMMETAEGHHPFLPRFAIKRIKERRQNTNWGGHYQRRYDFRAQRPPCKRPYRYY